MIEFITKLDPVGFTILSQIIFWILILIVDWRDD